MQASRSSINTKTAALAAIVIFAGLGLFGSRTAFGTSAAQSYDNIQIFVSPQNSTLNQFSLEAYNSTGGLVASSQSSYPAFSLELPSGNYLFAVTATSPYNYPIYAAVGSTVGSAKSGIAYPPYNNPEEYGYFVTDLNSSTTVNISTHQIGDQSIAKVSVTAKYANGTAAAGTSVYASIVGGYYVYDATNSLVLSNQTGSDGVATLIVPSVPLEITAWNWVPVNLPHNQTTTQVTIGGEPVNVTVYWQPTYVGLAGSALLIPPTSQVTITLKAQQQNFWAYPQGVSSTETTAPVPGVASSGASTAPGAVANGPGGVPESVAQSSQQPAEGSGIASQTAQNQIPSLPPSTVTQTVTTSATAQSSNSNLIVESGIAVAVIISIVSVLIAVRRK